MPWKKIKLRKGERMLLQIIFSEIQDVLPDPEKVKVVIDRWIKGYNLHPEEVKTLRADGKEYRFIQQTK